MIDITKDLDAHTCMRCHTMWYAAIYGKKSCPSCRAERLEKALDFYSNRYKWRDLIKYDLTAIEMDEGEIAREALKMEDL